MPRIPLIHLLLAGVPQARCAGQAAIALAPRDAALLAWLALEGPTPRERLAGLLWPTSPAAQARTALRQRLFQLKKQLGADAAIGTAVLRLADGVSHDLHAAVEVLGDLVVPDAPEVTAWLCTHRDQRQSRERQALEARAQSLEESGDGAQALAAAQALLRLEPLSEAAHRRVIRLHYLQGDRAAALLAFDACERMLKDEVGARPSQQTLDLLATIEAAAPSALPPTRRPIPAAVLRPPRMVGREREARALAMAWNGGHVAAVIGEAGIGKSRLLAEFADAHEGTVRCSARPGDAGVPFATLARLLREVGAGRPQRALTTDDRQQLARVLPELGLAGVDLAGGQRLGLQRAIEQFLRTAGGLEGLLVDDLHFADAASLEMLQALAADLQSLSLGWALAYRPAEAGTPLRTLELALEEAAGLVAIPLPPLDEAALAELIDQLGLGLEGRAMARPLLQRTGGNPLFVLETIKQSWVDQSLGALARGTGMPKPLSVERLMDRRLAQLSPMALALARTAGIAGVDFQIQLAEVVLGSGAMHLADALNELESAQVLRGTHFAHDLVLDAVVRSVPPAIARHTHLQVARWLEAHGGEPARIAVHWLQAGQPGAAVRWLKAAGEAAGKALRAKEHCDFLLQAADIEEALGEPARAFETLRPVVEQSLHKFMPDPLLLADRLDRLASTPRHRVQALIDRSGLLSHYWRMPEALDVARRAAALAEDIGDEDMLIDARHEIATNASMAGDARMALSLFAQIESQLQASPGAAVPEGFLSNYAIALERGGRLHDAVKVYLRYVDQERQQGDWSHVARALGNLAITRNLCGHARQALADAREALRLYSMYDEAATATCGVRLSLARLTQTLGHWRESLHWIEDVEATSGKPDFYAASIVVRRTECWIDLGQFSRAVAALESVAMDGAVVRIAFAARCELARARRWMGQPWRDELERARLLLPADPQADLQNRLRLQLEACDPAAPEAARAITDGVIATATALGLDGMVMAAWDMRARCLCTHDSAAAVRAAEQALELAAEFEHSGLYKPELWLHAAQVLRAGGQAERAHGWVRQAVAWVHERVAAGDVPPEFVDSFLHRNPVNRALLTWLPAAAPAAAD